jgi:hypothetical protein
VNEETTWRQQEIQRLNRRVLNRPLQREPFDAQRFGSVEAVRILYESMGEVEEDHLLAKLQIEQLTEKNHDFEVQIATLNGKLDEANTSSSWSVAFSIAAFVLGGLGANLLTTGVTSPPSNTAFVVLGAAMILGGIIFETIVYLRRTNVS